VNSGLCGTASGRRGSGIFRGGRPRLQPDPL